jgi:hypothetical protein
MSTGGPLPLRPVEPTDQLRQLVLDAHAGRLVGSLGREDSGARPHRQRVADHLRPMDEVELEDHRMPVGWDVAAEGQLRPPAGVLSTVDIATSPWRTTAAPLRCLIGRHGEPMFPPGSDSAGQLSERRSDAESARDVESELIVSTANVLDEACPAMVTVAVRSVRRPRIGLSQCLGWR